MKIDSYAMALLNTPNASRLVGQKVSHKKNGDVYRIQSISLDAKSHEWYVVYQCERTHITYHRALHEFVQARKGEGGFEFVESGKVSKRSDLSVLEMLNAMISGSHRSFGSGRDLLMLMEKATKRSATDLIEYLGSMKELYGLWHDTLAENASKLLRAEALREITGCPTIRVEMISPGSEFGVVLRDYENAITATSSFEVDLPNSLSFYATDPGCVGDPKKSILALDYRELGIFFVHMDREPAEEKGRRILVSPLQ